jgi:hypothetical protein
MTPIYAVGHSTAPRFDRLTDLAERDRNENSHQHTQTQLNDLVDRVDSIHLWMVAASIL